MNTTIAIKCEDYDKILAVLNKLQNETKVKWITGDKPTEQTLEPYIYPVWLILRDYMLTWAEGEKTHSMENMDEIDASEFLEYDLTDTADDPVNHPSHYTQGKVECIDAMEQVFGVEAVKHFCLLNWFKYNFRHELKNGQEDLEKASWYFKKYQELLNR